MRIPDYTGHTGDIINAEAANNYNRQGRHFKEQMQRVLNKSRENKIRQARTNAKIEKYLGQMPEGVDTLKVPASSRPALQSWAKNKHIEFGNYAQQAAIAESQGDYNTSMNMRAKMAAIEDSFKNMDVQLTNFKNYKDNFLKDAEDGLISNSVNPDKRDLLASIYTDEMNMQFSDEGTIMFTNDEGYISFDDVPDYNVKNNKGATEILKINESVYNSGLKMTDNQKQLIRMKLQNVTKSRDEVMSLATDDFITEGGLGILDDDLLYNHERIDELRNMVIDSYMKMFEETSQAGYQNNLKKAQLKKSKSSSGSARYNSMVNNFLEGYNQLQKGDIMTLLRYLPGDYNITASEEVEGVYELQKGSGTARKIDPSNPEDFKHILALANIPQNYWPKLQTVSNNEEVDTSFED